MYKSLLIFSLLFSIVGAQDFYYKNKTKVFLTPVDENTTLSRSSQRNTDILYYTTPTQKLVGVKNEIIVQTKHLESTLQNYGLTLVRELAKDIYLVCVDQKSKTLDLANKLYEDPDIEYAHPNFYKKVQKR